MMFEMSELAQIAHHAPLCKLQDPGSKHPVVCRMQECHMQIDLTSETIAQKLWAIAVSDESV